MGENFKTCSIEDSALDIFEMSNATGPDEPDRVKHFLETRDFGLTMARPGEKLTVFHLRELSTRVFMRFVDDSGSDTSRYMRAFQAAVVRIDDLVTPDGARIDVMLPDGRETGMGGGSAMKFISDDQLDLIPSAYIREIGAVAYQRSRLGKASAAGFQPLPSSLTGWQMRISEEARSRAAESRAKKLSSPSSEELPAPESSPDDGESPTDVTAEESE